MRRNVKNVTEESDSTSRPASPAVPASGLRKEPCDVFLSYACAAKSGLSSYWSACRVMGQAGRQPGMVATSYM